MVCAMLSVVCVIVASDALAQEVPKLKPDTSGWISVVVAVVLAIGVAVGSFINPKRSHRD